MTNADLVLGNLPSSQFHLANLIFRPLTLGTADPAFDRGNQGKLAKATGSTEEDALAIVENFRETSFLTSPNREHTCDWESGHQA